MKRKKYKRSKQGYKKTSPDKEESGLMIPSSAITMAGVGKKLIGAGLDENGNLKQIKFMSPEEEYDFKKVYSVLEMPNYQLGGEINPMTGKPFSMEEVVVTGQDKSLENFELDENILDAQSSLNFMNSLPQDDVEQQNRLALQNATNQEINSIEEEPQDITAPSKTQFFNPYGGVDIPTAASVLGSSIESGNTLGTIGSAAKLITGLGRNIFGEMGRQRASQQAVDEYNEKQRDHLTRATYQDGGQSQSIEDLFQTAKDNKPQITEEEILSGQYSSEDDLPQNAEIEKGEQRQDPETGDVTEVKGNTHEQGGVAVHLKEGEKILSDHTKLGADTAKMFKKDFELDLKAKDTYSTVIDRFVTKSGLKKLYREQEELIKKVEKETEKDDSPTKDINMEFLSKKIKEIEDKKKPLEETKTKLFDRVYEVQESKKPKSEQQDTFQIGGQMYNSDQVTEIAKEYGIDSNRAKELVSKYRQGGIKVGDTDPKTGKKVTEAEAKAKVASGEWESLGRGEYVDRGESSITNVNLNSYRQTWDKNKFPNFEDYVRAAEQWKKDNPNWRTATVAGTPDKFFYTEEQKAKGQTMPVKVSNPEIETSLPNLQPIEIPTEPTPVEEDGRRQALQALLLPEQYTVPPSALQPVLKNQRRYGRLDATLIDPTRQLSELDRQQLSAQDTLNQRPDASAQATLAQITANTQQTSNQVISQANQANQQAQQRADAFNIRQGDREEDAAAQDALSYEQRMFQGMSNTENDIRDYFQTLQNTQMVNNQTVNELNYMNALYDKFQFDGQGFKQIGTSDSKEEMERKIKFAQATNQKLRWGGRRKKY